MSNLFFVLTTKTRPKNNPINCSLFRLKTKNEFQKEEYSITIHTKMWKVFNVILLLFLLKTVAMSRKPNVLSFCFCSCVIKNYYMCGRKMNVCSICSLFTAIVFVPFLLCSFLLHFDVLLFQRFLCHSLWIFIFWFFFLFFFFLKLWTVTESFVHFFSSK